MPYPFTNRKRVRGWKNSAKKIDHLKADHLKINLPLLEKYGRDYVELTISPWNNLTPRNPPFWYRRLFLDALVEIYDSWEKQLKGLKLDYYLKIWLYDPRFHQTQVVAAVGDQIERYNNLFLPNERLTAAPPSSYDSNLFKVGKFQWQTRFDTIQLAEKDDELSNRDIEYCKTKSVAHEAIDGDTIYFVKKGDLWIGEKI